MQTGKDKREMRGRGRRRLCSIFSVKWDSEEAREEQRGANQKASKENRESKKYVSSGEVVEWTCFPN